jgi:hypothetical protein
VSLSNLFIAAKLDAKPEQTYLSRRSLLAEAKSCTKPGQASG